MNTELETLRAHTAAVIAPLIELTEMLRGFEGELFSRAAERLDLIPAIAAEPSETATDEMGKLHRIQTARDEMTHEAMTDPRWNEADEEVTDAILDQLDIISDMMVCSGPGASLWDARDEEMFPDVVRLRIRDEQYGRHGEAFDRELHEALRTGGAAVSGVVSKYRALHAADVAAGVAS